MNRVRVNEMGILSANGAPTIKVRRVEVILFTEFDDELKTSVDLGEAAQTDKERIGNSAKHLAEFAFLLAQHIEDEDE